MAPPMDIKPIQPIYRTNRTQLKRRGSAAFSLGQCAPAFSARDLCFNKLYISITDSRPQVTPRIYAQDITQGAISEKELLVAVVLLAAAKPGYATLGIMNTKTKNATANETNLLTMFLYFITSPTTRNIIGVVRATCHPFGCSLYCCRFLLTHSYR